MADILQLLVVERDRLNRAIAALQGEGEPKRRGRPPGSKTVRRTKKRGRRKMGAAQKKAVSDRMKKYWAARRKGTK